MEGRKTDGLTCSALTYATLCSTRLRDAGSRSSLWSWRYSKGSGLCHEVHDSAAIPMFTKWKVDVRFLFAQANGGD